MVARGGSRSGWGGCSASIVRPFLRAACRRHALLPALLTFLACVLLACQTASPAAAQPPGAAPESSQLRPDGTVLLVNNTTGDVYINLTTKDALRPGVVFTCYDPRTGITLGTDASALGDGSIEVMAVTDTFTRCRIMRTTSNRAIRPGDLLYNTLYHNTRNRPPHFVLYGVFDLDGDGVPTAAERDRLATIIRAWGGVIDDTINAHTDYLVLGARPRSPALPVTAAEDAAGGIVAVRTGDQKRYDELEDTAQQLAIPVLDLNRLLSLVGYYNDSIAHR